jgi:hypothetical protein
MPHFTFDPTTNGTVDPVNHTLHLPGLSAFNGQVLTYYADPNYSNTVSVPALASAQGGNAVGGSNRWDGVVLPDSIADGSLVAASFLSGIALPIGPAAAADLTPTDTTAPPSQLAGLDDGTSLWLRQLRDAQGNPIAVELFRDAAGTDPLLLADATDPDTLAYFQVGVRQSQGSVPIAGLTPGVQFQLHALGNDLYQVATEALQYVNSQPFALRGQQITAATALLKQADTPANTSTVSAPGISLTTKVDAKDKAKSSGGTGSNPKSRDYASNPWLGLNAIGNGGSAFLGTKFKDSIKKVGGKDNENFTKSQDNGSVAGSVAVNVIDHQASISLGKSSTLTSSGTVTLNNQTKTLLNTWSEASTDLDNNKKGVLSVGVAVNTVTNHAKSTLEGTIQPRAGSTTLPNVSITNIVAYPSLFFDTFGNGDQAKKFFSNPANAVGALSSISGTLMQNGFNSFATIKNKGKATKSKADGSQETGSNLAVAISVNYSQVDNLATTSLNGTIRALNLTITNTVDNSLVLGAGMLHQDFGLDRVFSGFIGGKASFFGGTKGSKRVAEDWGAAFQEFLSWGNVGKNGIGASLQLLELGNQATLTIGSNANIALTGSLTASNKQAISGVKNSADTTQGANELVSLVVGGGSSENFGLTGSVTVTYGDGNITGTTVENGAKIQATQAELNALDAANKVDVAGALQYSSAVGLSTSIIINQSKRRTYNLLHAPLEITNADELGTDPNLSLVAEQGGSITAVSAAGTFQTPDENLSKNTSNSLSYWGGSRITSFGLAAAGSVNVLQLADSATNTIGASDSSSRLSGSAPYRIRASASDNTKLQNWSGALAFGKNGATQPTGFAA